MNRNNQDRIGSGMLGAGSTPSLRNLVYGEDFRKEMSAMQMGKAILLGVARPGFDTDLALRMFRESAGLLEKLGATVLRPDGLVTDPDEAGTAGGGVPGCGGGCAGPPVLHLHRRAIPDPHRRRAGPADPDLVGAGAGGGRTAAPQLADRRESRGEHLGATGSAVQVDLPIAERREGPARSDRWLAAAPTAPRLRQAVIAEVGNRRRGSTPRPSMP